PGPPGPGRRGRLRREPGESSRTPGRGRGGAALEPAMAGQEAPDLAGRDAVAGGRPVAVVREVRLSPAFVGPAQCAGQVQHGNSRPRPDLLQPARDALPIPAV